MVGKYHSTWGKSSVIEVESCCLCVGPVQEYSPQAFILIYDYSGGSGVATRGDKESTVEHLKGALKSAHSRVLSPARDLGSGHRVGLSQRAAEV